MVDTDDTRRTTDDSRRTMDDGRRTTPGVWHKLPTGELKRSNILLFDKFIFFILEIQLKQMLKLNFLNVLEKVTKGKLFLHKLDQ